MLQNYRQVFIIIFILINLSTPVSGQVSETSSSFPPWSFGGRINYGSLLRFEQSQPLLNLTNIESVEIYAIKKTFGNDSWSEYYKYPEIEIAFSAYRFDMYKEFGNMFSIGPSLEYPIIKGSRSSLNLGIGLAANRSPCKN